MFIKYDRKRVKSGHWTLPLKKIFKEGYLCTSILYMVILRQLFFLFGDLEFNIIYIAVIMDKNVLTFFGVQMFPLDCEYI